MNKPIPTKVIDKLIRFAFSIRSRKKSHPNTAVMKITTPDRIGNWIEESMVTAHCREKIFPIALHTAYPAASGSSIPNNFGTMGFLPIS